MNTPHRSVPEYLVHLADTSQSLALGTFWLKAAHLALPGAPSEEKVRNVRQQIAALLEREARFWPKQQDALSGLTQRLRQWGRPLPLDDLGHLEELLRSILDARTRAASRFVAA